MTLKPMPGHCICEVESQYKAKEGLIFIPRTGRQLKGKIGRICVMTLWMTGQPAWVWKKGRKVLVAEPWKLNPEYMGLLDARVAFEQYREFIYQDQLLAHVRFEHIVAEIGDEVVAKVEGHVGGVPRCPRCQSKGELNIMLDSSGYCPNCGQNPKGDRKEGKEDQYGLPLSDRVSDEEKEAFDPSPKKLKGTITTYAKGA